MTSTHTTASCVRTGRRGGRTARPLAVFLAVALAPCLGGATDFSAVFEADADAAGGQEVAWEGYHSMNAFMSGAEYDYFWSALDIASTFSMGGFASDGHQYHVLLEATSDVGAGYEVYLVTYESLADFQNNIQLWSGFTAQNTPAALTTRGFAADGSRFYQVWESDADAGGGAEVYVASYTSWANLISGYEDAEGFSPVDIISGWSIADLATDGEKFYLVLETDANAGSGAEIYVMTYASFADVLFHNLESSGYSSMDVNGDFSIKGFAADMFSDGFESGDTSAWSATVP